jgi:hypothetical protein
MRAGWVDGVARILWIALLLAPHVAAANDVEIQLGSGDDFVIKDSGAVDRWRIDEAGELTRSGSLFLHGGADDTGVALGNAALDAHTSGPDNVAIGGDALGSLGVGNDNIAIDDFAGSALTSGQNNVYIANSGSSSESFRIRIGSLGLHSRATVAGQVDFPSTTEATLSGDGALMLGAESGFNMVLDRDEIQGRNNGTYRTVYVNPAGGNVVLGHNPNGRVQIPWVNPNSTVMTDGSSFLYGATSTRRHKRNLEPFEDDYEKILAVSPYTFEYVDGPTFPKGKFMGYMAEDLHEQGMSSLVRYDDAGLPVNINYNQISVYLVELLKRQRTALTDQARLLDAQRDENATLTARMDALEARLAELDIENQQ